MGRFALALVVSILGVLAACHAAESPPRGLEATCVESCESRAAQCGRDACARGCNLVLDRLAEHEGGHVIACVASAGTVCDDRTWARCGALVGPHADGGPPAPPPPPELDEDQE